MASGVTSSEDVPGFPQTSLQKLAHFLAIFPPPHSSLSTPSQFANLLLAIHPSLSYITPPSWRALETAFEGAGLGEWSAGVAECDPADVGLLGEGIWGWRLASIERSGERSAKVTFVRGGGAEKVVVDVPAGPRPFEPFPLQATPTFHLTPRFEHLLASLFQLHALGRFDISVLPPSSSLQSSSSSTTVLIATFAKLLGYELETIHLYKEIGGREIWMRRVVESGVGGGKAGVTGWEPSPLVKGAWEGKLVHLEGIDALGATVGSLGRLLGEREGELWEGKRLVGGEPLSVEEVRFSSFVRPFVLIVSCHLCRKLRALSRKPTPPSASSPPPPSRPLLANGSPKNSPRSSSPSRPLPCLFKRRSPSSSRPDAHQPPSTLSRSLRARTGRRTRLPGPRVAGWARRA